EIFSVFPNPANDVLTVTPKDKNKNEFKIVDVNGRLIQLIPPGYGTVKADINSLDAGIYFIELNNSKEIFRQKFVKE
ncbi:MAG: T9SS type A sorting domain-containing protein, partial [Bacteroidota bacterium]